MIRNVILTIVVALFIVPSVPSVASAGPFTPNWGWVMSLLEGNNDQERQRVIDSLRRSQKKQSEPTHTTQDQLCCFVPPNLGRPNTAGTGGATRRGMTRHIRKY